MTPLTLNSALWKSLLDIDPRKYVDLRSLKYIDELASENMSDFGTGLKSMDMETALIVGFWICKIRGFSSVVLELWDGSSNEKSPNDYVEKYYDKGNE